MSDGTEAVDLAPLYAVPPDRFVAERNTLAKALRAEGRKPEAAEVAKLRRPTPPAWALDQVARADPDLVSAALDAGEALRLATDRAIAGDRDALRDATRAQRRAMDELVNSALGHLRDIRSPVNDAMRRRIADTVLAATSDDAVAEQLRAGRLHEDHQATSFGFGDAANSAPAATAAPNAEPDERATRAARAAELQAHARRLEADADTAQAAADTAQAEANTAQAAANTAQAAANTARAVAEQARSDADAASRELA